MGVGSCELEVVVENTLMPVWRENPANVRPMLATLAHPPLTGKGLVFEPKYDGIRALVHIAPGKSRPDVRLWSRLGNDKTTQFPSIVRALEPLARSSRRPCSSTARSWPSTGRPAGGFQRLQGRIHLKGSHDIEALDHAQPAAFIAFDLLRDGDEDVRGLPLTERRDRLERAPRTVPVRHSAPERTGRRRRDGARATGAR